MEPRRKIAVGEEGCKGRFGALSHIPILLTPTLPLASFDRLRMTSGISHALMLSRLPTRHYSPPYSASTANTRNM